MAADEAVVACRESNSKINMILLYAVNTGAITGCVDSSHKSMLLDTYMMGSGVG